VFAANCLDKLARFFRNSLDMKTSIPPVLITFALACFALLPTAQAVVPPPDGGYPGFNTAEGQNALMNLTTGAGNTAVGWYSLFSDTTASFNTGVGAGTLLFNNANGNTAVGAAALLFNTLGDLNTAVGAAALRNNTKGVVNTAIGNGALAENVDGASNAAVGADALAHHISGSHNVALGADAGFQHSTGSNNIYIGFVQGTAVESDSCYIGSIFGQTSSGGIGVLVNSNGKLGTTTSSERFKEEIKPMDKASEALLSLKPVIFRYKNEIDAAGTTQFGLVAEDVERVNPDLIVRDKDGKPYSVRYDQVNAMLLNEFLKEHRKVEKLEATVADLATTVKEQAAHLQRVSAQLDNSVARVAVTNR
jgi:Chaperone of endosialidase